jgi:hypothetical protein
MFIRGFERRDRASNDAWVADDRDTAAISKDGRAFGNRLNSVVSTFAMHVRPQQFEEWRDSGLGENRDVVDTAKCSDEFSAFGRFRIGRPGPFVAAAASSFTATMSRSASNDAA